MICAKQYHLCKDLAIHLLQHDATDLKVLGFERFMLAKVCRDKIDE